MCEVQLRDRTRSEDLMLMLGLNETIDQLAMANSVCWYSHMLRREDGHVLRRVLDFEVEGQRKKGGQRGHGENRFRKKCVGWCEKGRCTLPIKVECWC